MGNVVVEGDRVRSTTPVSPRYSDRRNPRVTRLFEATRDLEAALASHAEGHPGLIVAVRTAGQALVRHDWLTEAAFGDVYQYVEAEIPFRSLENAHH